MNHKNRDLSCTSAELGKLWITYTDFLINTLHSPVQLLTEINIALEEKGNMTKPPFIPLPGKINQLWSLFKRSIEKKDRKMKTRIFLRWKELGKGPRIPVKGRNSYRII